ncbi:hypothetical protein WG906_18175 [Pedobacter sp. P351]|uniref:hypothetical protein n=1 Tax=Pedobacter superstes TaxID=3133441 RepID=UPI0030AE1EC2
MSEEDIKDVKELYLRNLSQDESAEVKTLQLMFSEKTATGAAKRAMFNYSKLHKSYTEAQQEIRDLKAKVRELENNLQNLNYDVIKHFDLEFKLQNSKRSLLAKVNGEPTKP